MLRNRILLGVAPLIILLMVVGGYAVWLFVRLGGAVNTTLHENYTSIVAMRDLKEHALRIDQALLAYHAKTATLPQTQSVLEQQAALCRRNVEAELGDHHRARRTRGRRPAEDAQRGVPDRRDRRTLAGRRHRGGRLRPRWANCSKPPRPSSASTSMP